MDQGQPSTSRAVQPNNPHFSDRIRNMLLQESESECDDDLEDFADSDDSDADRTYIPPQEDDFKSSHVDVNVDTHPEDVEVTAQVPVEAPEFYYGKTSRNGSVPGYKWSSKEPQVRSGGVFIPQHMCQARASTKHTHSHLLSS
ncbi:hypothetical protein J6590_084492 [Homalodisca vitripennis]|nr:hypothetical protein J6590_084492 [Homalodisca vitripennis]